MANPISEKDHEANDERGRADRDRSAVPLERDPFVAVVPVLPLDRLRLRRHALRFGVAEVLCTALDAAVELDLPVEAKHIRSVFRRFNLRLPT